jgi:hypothetical protein
MARGIFLLAASLAAWWPGGAQAARVDAPALPVERVVTIQPIQVCQPACADTTFLAQYITAANVILNQARIAVAAAPTVRFDAPAAGPGSPNFLNLTTSNNLFDDIRALVRDHGRAANSTTLNVFLVNSITDTTGGRRTPLYGWGLIGGNGSVVATGVRNVEVSPGVFQSRTAAVDTLAHELAHNLGLPHPEDLRLPVLDTDGRPLNDARNLMRSVGRAALTDFCQVPPYTCTGAGANAVTGQRAALSTRQIGTGLPGSAGSLRNPLLLTQLPSVVTQGSATDGGNSAGSGLGSSTPGQALIRTEFAGAAPAALRSVEFRYRGAFADAGAFGFSPDGGPMLPNTPMTPTVVIDPLGNPNQVWRATVPAGQTFLPPAFLRTSFSVSPVGGFTTSSRPQSSQYEFANGVTTRAGFDATGVGDGTVSSSDRAFAFALNPADGDGLPSLIPQDLGLPSPVLPGGGLTEALVEANFTTPEILAGLALPEGATDFLPTAPPGNFAPPPAPPADPDPLAVTAPGALGLFALGLFALGLLGVLLARRSPAAG